MTLLSKTFAIGAAAAAIALAGSAASAATPIVLTYHNGVYTGSFADTVTGSFTDAFTFNLPQSGVKYSFSITSTGVDTDSQIVPFTGYLDTNTTANQFTFTTSTDSDGNITTTGKLSGTNLASGSHSLVFSGDVADAASYGGSISIRAAAVPETATWAMMIGGIGFVGGAMRRRNTRTSVSFA